MAFSSLRFLYTMLTSILPHNRSHKNPPKWWPMQAKIEIRKAPLIVSCIQSYTSSIYSFIHPLYRPLPRQSSCQCLHPESSHLCRYLSNPTTHRCASAASAHQISIVEFINFLEFVYAFFPGPGPNVQDNSRADYAGDKDSFTPSAIRIFIYFIHCCLI